MTRTVPTPVGPARAHLDLPALDLPALDLPTPARRTLVLGHGAGGGSSARDLAALAEALPAYGVGVVRVDQPWRVAGRRVAPAPRTLDVAWRAVVAQLDLPGPLVVGGRSAGARVACRTAAELGAVGVLALAFPLHPPGRPERSRVAELLEPAQAGLPLLVVQGERDAFGRPGEFPPEVDVRPVPGADHGMARADLAAVVETVAHWLLAL